MATNHTQYYGLSQWLAEDKVERVDFNGDNEKIDAALRALSTGKANSATVTALTNTVAKKAEQSDLEDLQATVAQKAQQADLAALTNVVSTKATQTAVDTLADDLEDLQATVEENALTHTQDVAALRGENYWTKITSFGLTGSGTLMDIQIPNAGIYREIVLYCAIRGGGKYPMQMRVNNITADDSYLGGDGYSDSYMELTRYGALGTGLTIRLSPFGISGGIFALVEGAYRDGDSAFSISRQYLIPNVTMLTLTSVQIRDLTELGSGSLVTVYGLKK